MRHYLNLRIIFSLLTEFRTVGPYELNWETQQYKCLLSNIVAFGLLAALQALNIFWLFCLLRSAYRIVVYRVAKDDRSEDEDEGEGEELEEVERTQEEMKTVKALPLLNGNGLVDGSANVIKASGNGTPAPPTRRKGAL